jgi:predicted nucleic acid-binding protein
VLVDASPLIYLAKIDALDVFAASGNVPLLTKEVEREVARPSLAYEHPDSLLIADALASGLLQRTELTAPEIASAERLHAAGGLDRGEAEVLAAAVSRGVGVLLFERRATRLARSMAIDTWTPLRILFAGTADHALLATRIREFAALVHMRFEDVEAALRLIEEHEE